MAVGSEYAGKLGAYTRRGTGNQRHRLGHDLKALKLIALYAGDGADESIRKRRNASHLRAYRHLRAPVPPI
jgi:hypothetical protein